MGQQAGDLVMPTDTNTAQAVKVLGVISAAHTQGGESARRLIVVQTDALEKAYNANNQLVEQVVEMVSVVKSAAEQTATIAKISAERDIELARLKSNNDAVDRLTTMAEGPVAQALLAKFGVLPSVPLELKQAAGRVIARLFAKEEVCRDLQAEHPDDYTKFLEYIEKAL